MQRFRLLFFFILALSFMHGVYTLWHYKQDHWPADLYNQPVELEGMVTDLPRLQNHTEQFWFQTKMGLIQLNWYPPFPDLKPGDMWRLTAKMKPDTFENNSGEFDYGHYLQQQGVVAEGYVRANPAAQKLGAHPWQTAINSLRYAVYQRVLAATNGLSMQGVLIALILGDKSHLNQNEWQTFSASGTSYFMVISGLHIVLFAMMGGLALRYLWCLIPRAALLIPAQRMGLILGLAFGLLYSILAGFPVPTQRALWMLWLMGLASLFRQRFHPLTLLFAALAIVVLWDPLSLNSIAFWLSFIAVFFLIYTLSSRRRALRKWQEWIYPQWVMYVTLMPILIYAFHEFSVISLFTNFVAMPFMMLAVIPLALLGGLVLFISAPAGKLLFFASNWIMNGVWLVLEWATNLPHAMVLLPEPSLFSVCFSLLGCLILFAPRGIPFRVLGVLFILPLLLPVPILKPHGLKTTTLTLPEGSVTLFETAHSVIVLQNIQHLRAAKSAIHEVIEPYLEADGKNEIQLWVINGTKNYHALHSLENTWQTTKIDKIMLPHLPTTYDSNLLACDSPQTWSFDSIQFMSQADENGCTIKAN